jgi:uncharacterized repeat protein (TIGR01451 family)
MKPKYLLMLFALGLGLALVSVLGGRGGAAVAAPAPDADGRPGIEGARAGRHAGAANAPAAELHVCLDGCPYSSIQDAVDAADDPGDVIKVAAGTYTGVNSYGSLAQVVYVSKTVTIRGGYTVDNWTTPDPENNPTTLDAGGQGRVLYVTGNISPTLAGLRITGGDATVLGGYWDTEYGGGVYVARAAAVIVDNQVFDNIADYGGGLYLSGSNATISGNTISRNGSGGLYLSGGRPTVSGNTISRNGGGGLRVSGGRATVNGNTITNNTADHAGGILLSRDAATLSENTITDNTADANFPAGSGRGGGLYLNESAATISGNTISGNTATGDFGRGGGLYLDGSNATISGNTISGNTAYDVGPGGNALGGGLFLTGDNATLVNNVIAGNQARTAGSGLYISGSSSRLLHNTIAHNTGGDGSGVYLGGGTVALTNTILVSHAVGIYVSSSATALMEGMLWNGNTADWSGEGTVSRSNDVTGDPAFVAPEADDYHIGPGSAAIDAGVNAGVTPLCLYDIDGDSRPAAFGPDIGADERPGVSLHIQKAAWPSLLNPGQAVTYTLVVTSAGVDTASDVWLTDTLPALQQAVAITPSRGSCATGAGWGTAATCDLGTLLPGEGVRITLTARVTTTAQLPWAMAQLPWRMRNTAWIKATETMSNAAYADATLHDCHVRLNDDPTEYTTVQAGVDASTHPTDVVKVAGCCAEVTHRAGLAQIAYLSKTLTLQGGWNTAFTERDAARFPTTLNARGQGRVLYITAPATGAGIRPTIEGLHITGGDAAGLRGRHWRNSSEDVGGGVYVLTATAVISGNQVFGNTAELGGGLFLEYSDATLSGSTVSGNVAAGEVSQGGGLFLWYSDATISGNTITGNTARGIASDRSWGGGLFLAASDATLSGNIISGNTAAGTYDAGGGGLFVGDSDATLDGNTITDNTANYGGGLYLNSGGYLGGGDATLINNVIAGNQAHTAGGGLYIDSSSPRLLHNTIARNTGGDGSGVHVTHAHVDSGDNPPSTVALTNTILAGHAVGIYVDSSDTAFLESTLWNGNTTDWDGEGIIHRNADTTGDPAFADPGAGDYHVRPGSAAIDAGTDAGVDHDVDGEPRPLGSGYDLGADETGLVVTQQAYPDRVQPGAPLTYTIRITNVAGVDLHATIADTLPEQISPGRTSAGTAILPGGVVTWTPVIIPPQQVWTQTVVVTVELGYAGPLVNVVEVTTLEGVTGRHVLTLAPNLAVSKRAHADTVLPGEQLTCTIAVTNTGNFDLHASITDTLPAHVTAGRPAGGTTVLPGGKLVWTPVVTAPGGVWTETVVFTVAAGYRGPLTNMVWVTTQEGTTGDASVTVGVGRYIYLPASMRSFPSP